ncbi:MAG: tyrosine-type recombinase/integrase [Bryobacteraceae bacterium]
MAVYRPKYKDPSTGKMVEAELWWYDFTFAGRRIRESTKTHLKTLAREAEQNRRRELERAFVGAAVENRDRRVRTATEVIDGYLARYELDHRTRPKSIAFAKGRLAQVKRLLGGRLLPDLTEDTIRGYITTRIEEGMSGRTVNMEIGELSRAIGMHWSVLWPKVRKQEERKNAGRALSPDEEARLLEAAGKKERWRIAAVIIRALLLTGMRSGELVTATWAQVDFGRRVLTVGRAKTSSGTGREIPMNNDLYLLLSTHAEWFARKFGAARPEYCLFPFGKPQPTDPTRPTTTLKTVWTSIRDEAKVACRLHDLRHTAATKMAEAGAPESTMLALMGHLSRQMMEHYSHIRMAAKREAVESLSITVQSGAKPGRHVKESPNVEEAPVIK